MSSKTDKIIRAFKTKDLYLGISLIEKAFWRNAETARDVKNGINEVIETLSRTQSDGTALRFCQALLSAAEQQDSLAWRWFLKTVVVLTGWKPSKDPEEVVDGYLIRVAASKLISTQKLIVQDSECPTAFSRMEAWPRGPLRALMAISTLGGSELVRIIS